ncbi:MAG: hypothetical protein JWL62_1466 [Hyphomicrobiales bacterium]|nr:hypothetical protein [Hyphomicrobiales bacterium]
MRRISWTEDQISDGERCSLICALFFGASRCWAAPGGGGHHRERQSDMRDMSMPISARSASRFGLLGFKAVFNRPPVALELDKISMPVPARVEKAISPVGNVNCKRDPPATCETSSVRRHLRILPVPMPAGFFAYRW